MTAPAPAPGRLNAIADAIVQRLAGRNAFQTWKVGTFPEGTSRYPFTTPKELLVSYEGSDDTEVAFPGVTDRAMSWSVAVVARGLRGPEGAHYGIDAVRRAHQGWTLPQGGGAFVPTGDKFLSEEEGIFRYAVLFKVTLPSVSDPAVDNDPIYQPSGRREDGTIDLDTFVTEDIVNDPSPVDPTLLNNR